MVIWNSFKVTLKNIRNDRFYSIVNIAGLATALTSSLFILMFISIELGYDRYHKNAENIYRIETTITESENSFTWAVAQIPLAEELKDNYPEIKNVVRFFEAGRGVFQFGDKKFYEDNFYLADSNVFEMFSYKFLAGDHKSALINPHSIVLTKSAAQKYFPNIYECVGQAIDNQYGEKLKVTGVVEDIPFNSSLTFEGLISKSTLPDLQGSWQSFGVYTYIQLPEGYEISRVEKNLADIVRNKVQYNFEKSKAKISYRLQRLTDIHLYSKAENESETKGDINYIYVFSTMVVFLLTMAAINYTNLAITKSIKRSKEIAVRKILGSNRLQLIIQFLAESFFITLIALFVSLVIFTVMLPLFNDLVEMKIPHSYILTPNVLAGIFCMVVFLVFLGGGYPALYLSGLNTINVLKSKVAARKNHVTSSLVVLQFSISLFMLLSTLLISRQMSFIETRDLGFDKDRVIRLDITMFDLKQKAQVLVEDLKRIPNVSNVGFASTTIGGKSSKLLFSVEDELGVMNERSLNVVRSDFNFIKTMGIKVIQGRDFRNRSLDDIQRAVIVNEAMVKRMNWRNPIGKRISMDADSLNDVRYVVGVIRDYHQNSLHNLIEPLVLMLDVNVNYAFVRVKHNDMNTVSSIRGVWEKIFSGNTFEYHHLDKDFTAQHRNDEKRREIFSLFTIVAIVIACLGSLSLASYTMYLRSKEIAVRKVIGAGTYELLMLVSKEFVMLFMVSMLIAYPLGWYFSERWLENFAYRINLGNQWWVFIVAGVCTFAFVFGTIGYHAMKMIFTNPTKALNTE